MPRYIFKIPVLSLLDTLSNGSPLMDEIFSHVEHVEDDTFTFPGVSIKNAEMEVLQDTTAYVDFWVVKNIIEANIEDVLMGIDGIIFLADATQESTIETIQEYLKILRKDVHFLPSMIINIDGGSLVTSYNLDFSRKMWESYVCESVSMNRSNPGYFKAILYTLLEGIITHPDVGPIHHDTEWIRANVIWEILKDKLDGDVKKEDMAFLGNCFDVLYWISKFKARGDTHVLGSISSRWHEMGGNFLAAYKIAERLDNKERIIFLKAKYLNGLIEDGDSLFNSIKFEDAARKYEEAGFWNRAEAVDLQLGESIFKKAINAWVHAFNFSSAGDLLVQLNSPASFLSEIKDNIVKRINIYLKRDLLEKVNQQLQLISRLYIKHDLRASYNEFAKMHADVKLKILKEKINQKFVGDSCLLLDDLIKLKDQSGVDFKIPDEIIARVCEFMVEDAEFQEFEKLISFVDDQEVKRKLHKLRLEKEAQIEEEKRKSTEERKLDITQRLLAYHVEEKEDAKRYAEERRKILFDMISKGKERKSVYFLGINAGWLESCGHEDLASLLVFQVLEQLIKNGYSINILDFSKYLSRERLKSLADTILSQIEKVFEIDQENYYFSNYIEHFHKQLRKLDFYYHANGVRGFLINRLVLESTLMSRNINDDSVDIIKKKLDKIYALLSVKDACLDDDVNLSEVKEKLIDYYLEIKDVVNATKYVNQLEDMELKRRCSARLTRLSEDQKKLEADTKKLEDKIEKAREQLKEINRLLMLNKPDLSNQRVARFKTYQAWRENGKIPDVTAIFLTDEVSLERKIRLLEHNHQKVMDYALERRAHEEIALTLAIQCLIALKNDKPEIIQEYLDNFENSNLITKDKVREQPAYKLAQLLKEAGENQSEALIMDIIAEMDLLPLMNGERFFIYKILGKPIPEHMATRQVEDESDKFRRTLEEALPVLTDMIAVELEQIQESLVVKRQILVKKDDIQALHFIRKKDFEKASMIYQDDAFKFFDSGDLYLGWTSLWLSIISLLEKKMEAKEIIRVFNAVIKTCERNEEVANHPMNNVIVLFLKCLDRGEYQLSLDFQDIQDGLPLLDEEKDIFELKKALKRYFNK
ncbi:MAG: hypothetical protein ACFFCS_07820 [Candidatus Hodarchaeota archaeon]